MKKSELRKLIREEISNIHEQPLGWDCQPPPNPSFSGQCAEIPGGDFATLEECEAAGCMDDGGPQGGYFCMNDDDLSLPGYCVQQMGGQPVYEAMQNAGIGIWAQHPTLDACLASSQCSEEYTYSVYPPPQPGPFIGGNPIKGPQGPMAPVPKRKRMPRR